MSAERPDAPEPPRPWEGVPVPPATEERELTPEERTALLLTIAEECIKPEELYKLVLHKELPIAYDGFEPSGRMHIAQALLKAINVNKMVRAGCHVKIWIADWFAWMNNKLGGDLKKIQTCGRYFIEVWRALGMAVDGVEFVWASDEIQRRHSEYWPLVMDVARHNTVNRLIRCSQIMGRSQRDELTGAQLMYPCMQCADIFFLKADICQLGIDQRKVNVLAREYCDATKRRFKPVILSHHMLPGLRMGQEKMSKSDPDSAIFVEDSAGDVNRKIKRAFCPEGEAAGNPILEYLKYLVFPVAGRLDVSRGEAHGGPLAFASYDELERAFVAKELHPMDLKAAAAKAINTILEPVRAHFKSDPEARKLAAAVKRFKITK
eukprot:gnl/Chilomastix_cuspidata/391.p2 GENE.gnl/Chilomastix_cuspidata/391~~gnl/Chilomastix_cuspidata/391.p2  ORF type:complete len:378 (+),score=176.14 gnl/Chilomastix_cuspidata/391:28-1161(+)